MVALAMPPEVMVITEVREAHLISNVFVCTY